jgi:hypothetical protein
MSLLAPCEAIERRKPYQARQFRWITTLLVKTVSKLIGQEHTVYRSSPHDGGQEQPKLKPKMADDSADWWRRRLLCAVWCCCL